ncbi:MAG: tyrosine-type recombinase/integrase [Xenococcaceae cyanobacterium]
MIEIDWTLEYQKDFICPECEKKGEITKLLLNGSNHNKKRFKCPQCNSLTLQSSKLHKGHIARFNANGLGCPNEKCNARKMALISSKKQEKNIFKCQVCNASAFQYVNVHQDNKINYYYVAPPIKEFNFDDDEWDLRSINKSVEEKRSRFKIHFHSIKSKSLKLFVKKYFLGLCKTNTPYTTIRSKKDGFITFSDYLVKCNILNLNQVDRGLILDFLSVLRVNNTSDHKTAKIISNLKVFFQVGNLKGWFKVDPYIFRSSDYPKIKSNNPDPMPDIVREQIEKNLHKLPEPIARMWIVCFFAAMRPSELALLKKDCLEQIGDKWKLVWLRRKGKKFHQHSVPITTTIAKVIQEQIEYIEELWGKDWEYLFCHYYGVSSSDTNHPKLKPAKRLIPPSSSPLTKAIRTLIKTENITDDNGKPGKFQTRLIRETRLTELFLKGHDLSVVSAWAGHKKLATTVNFYIQVTCEQIEEEAGHIQSALVNADGKKIYYESMPKSFWENPVAHELEVAGTHVNTPIYGYCGLDLDEECDKFRACYTCRFFVAKPEKLSQYIKQRDELREKQEQALANGHSVLVEQFARQADQLDKIILSLQETA